MKLKTSIKTKHYVIAGIVAIAFIVVDAFIKYPNNFTTFCKEELIKYLVEIMATGLLPAILLAYLTDLANTSRQLKKYDKFKDNVKKPLLLMCEALPMTLYNCVLDSYDEIPEDFWKERNTFVNWCERLYNSENANEIKYFVQDINSIKNEAKSIIGILNSYQDFCDEEERINEIERINAIAKACEGFYTIIKENGKSVHKYTHNADMLAKSITNLFSSNDISKGYDDKYNCEDYDVE